MQDSATGANTVPVVPIYYIHSFERPFCTVPLCRCQEGKQQALRLFVQIIEGKADLQNVGELEGRTV
jgi:hypothetical protein